MVHGGWTVWSVLPTSASPAQGWHSGYYGAMLKTGILGNWWKITVRCSWFKQNGDLAFPLEGGHPELREQCRELFGDSATDIIVVHCHHMSFTSWSKVAAYAPAITSMLHPLEFDALFI